MDNNICPMCRMLRDVFGNCGCSSAGRPTWVPEDPPYEPCDPIPQYPIDNVPDTDGWKCPVCGGGNAPWVSQCPCIRGTYTSDTYTSSSLTVKLKG